jgi:hypothetical protein
VHVLINELVRVTRRFAAVLEVELAHGDPRSEVAEITRCPDQTQVAPILLRLRDMAEAMVEFFTVYDDFWLCPAAVMAVFMPFYGVFGGYLKQLREQSLQPNLVWEHAHQLFCYFSYFGCSMTAMSNIAQRVMSSTMWLSFAAESDSWDKRLKEPNLYAPREIITGLRAIAARALLLSAASDDDVRNSRTAWWCSMWDATPVLSWTRNKFLQLIEENPGVAEPGVAERLNTIATLREMTERERQAARDALDGTLQKTGPHVFSIWLPPN